LRAFAAVPLLSAPVARIRHEDLPHEKGGNREEVLSSLGLQATLALQFDVEVVYERGGTGTVGGGFSTDNARRHAVQLVIDERHSAMKRLA
jgi:hypothetical protein